MPDPPLPPMTPLDGGTQNIGTVDDDDTALIGGIVGGLGGFLLLAALAALCWAKQSKNSKPPRANLASAVPVEMMAPPVSGTQMQAPGYSPPVSIETKA